MNWERYRSVMERDAIKIDDMATSDAYFFATHMPFSQLEVYQGGRTGVPPRLMDEEEVFRELICNPEDEHRLIIVRGDNGTGKSHLIRYLKARLEHSPATVYNPEREQLIFLRRLNNSVRGVFGQLLEQEVVRDPEVREKLRKFVASTGSKDEAAFQSDILYAYIAAVSSDRSGRTYRAKICEDIASYLSDSRVRERLLRAGGAIDRCSQIITAPSSQVLRSTAVFTEADFNDREIIRNVFRRGDPQAADFAATLSDDAGEITRLVGYLNRFTHEVVQRCADISSESTKSVFEQLRKDLKKQGKALTLFVEDFTGFTGIDSELITVLSTEHGGDYADLCRVTAVIGITNDYYDQFRDNFTDRVTHQVSVTDRSYGTDDFLIQLAGRYLNAICCAPAELQAWCREGAELAALPSGGFTPPCPWETVEVGGQEVPLYPFNRRALLALYRGLPVKSPRMFLRDVLRAQLKEYFDGKEYGGEWAFPLNPGHVPMARDQHSSAIDRLEYLPAGDRARLKAVFALWADGSANMARGSEGTVTFGGLDRRFLEDIGLAAFQGIGGDTGPDGPAPGPRAEPSVPQRKPPADGPARDYQRYSADIADWLSSGAELRYHPDYRKWLQNFLCGDNRQCGAIDWQDAGIPAYIAAERLSDAGVFYIEGQGGAGDAGRALVYMDRSPESRDALQALNKLRYAKGWEFEGSTYYQQRLITWLERNRAVILEKVAGAAVSQDGPPVLEWCLALQYLRAMILGREVDTSTPLKTVESLMVPFQKDDGMKRETREWGELVQFVHSRGDGFDSALALLRKASVTTVGTIQGAREDGEKRLYRTDELLDAAERLLARNWDIEEELPGQLPARHMLYNPASLLKDLYPRIRAVVDAERTQAGQVIQALTDYIGPLDRTGLIDALFEVRELFSVFNMYGILGSSELQARYEKPPEEIAERVLRQLDTLKRGAQAGGPAGLSIYSGNALNALSDFLRDLQHIARMAEREGGRARKETEGMGAPADLAQLSESARAGMEALCEQLDEMEVRHAAE